MSAAPDGSPPLRLRRGQERRLREGHLWVFSNEVDVAATPLDAFAAGDPVRIVDAGGRLLGSGYVNPHSLICARLVDHGGAPLDRALLARRLQSALELRQRLWPEPFYRLVFGESDGLPGLVVDRFDDVLVAQATTAGIERLRDAVGAALGALLAPAALVWKNDAAARALEGLPSIVACGHGRMPERVRVIEGGLTFAVDVAGGQKTGWFYDQRSNRDLVAPLLRGFDVLDLFSYVGAWGLRAAAAGARQVLCVDASAAAVEAVRAHARDNRLDDRVQAERADAFDFLREARARGQRWQAVILDPPAFVKRRRDLREGALAYRRINEAALRVLAPGGLLVSASCSYHMPGEALLQAIQAAARKHHLGLQVLARLQQAPDHPQAAAIPETEYLKGFVCRVLPL